MHSVISDGSDTPEEIVQHVREAGIRLFSVTDHDAIKAASIIPELIAGGELRFLPGVEFSCKDEQGAYHILGYGYDPNGASVNEIVELGHSYRMNKFTARLQLLKTEFGIEFPEEDVQRLLTLDNPGKPHIANLMVKYGYAESIPQAMKTTLNRLSYRASYVKPEEAIAGILDSGGIPVLAHPSFGSGDQLILGDEMDQRLKRLIGYGLQGVEGFYSGFNKRLRDEILSFAEKYGLYVTAGSDYHGTHKIVLLGDTGLTGEEEIPEGMARFLADTAERLYS